MGKQVSVGIADMKILRQEGVLITYALGSCIGISFYDPMIKLGALLHIMLPEGRQIGGANLMKYADTGIRETLRKLNAFGGTNRRMVCKIAGGAKMFEMKTGRSWKYRREKCSDGKACADGRGTPDCRGGYRRDLCKDDAA